MTLRERLRTPGLVPGVFSFALAVAYIPGILGGAEAGRWALLSMYVPAACATAPKFTIGHLLGALLLAWAAMSLLWTPGIYDGAKELWVFVLYAGVFCIGAATQTLRPIYIGMGFGFALNSVVVVAQRYCGFDGVYQAVAPAGLFMNKNYVAEPATLVLIALLGTRGWRWLALAVLPAAVLPGARGALLGLAAAAVAWLWPRSRAGAAFLVGVAAIACFMALHTGSVVHRFEIWRDTIAGLTPLGRGIGSYFVEFPAHASLTDLLSSRPAHAHNDFLEVAFEFGAPGLTLFASFLCVCLCASRLTERAVLLAFITEAAFAFPLHLPVTGFVAALAAGHLCGARYSLRVDVASWRMAVFSRALAIRPAQRGRRQPTTRAGHLPA